jgi:hypothetical protein
MCEASRFASGNRTAKGSHAINASCTKSLSNRHRYSELLIQAYRLFLRSNVGMFASNSKVWVLGFFVALGVFGEKEWAAQLAPQSERPSNRSKSFARCLAAFRAINFFVSTLATPKVYICERI